MAALLEPPPPPPYLNRLLPSNSNPTRPFRHTLKFKRLNLSNNPTLLLIPHSQPTTTTTTTAPCSVATPEFPDPSPEYASEPTRDRRRAVRLAWEKLVRWSRSLRSKTKTDVLERTNKVHTCLPILRCAVVELPKL